MPRDCPCHSGLRYVACCAPYHRGEQPPPTPVALMRSRYAAFALGLGGYLVDTLSEDHADRTSPREALVRELSRAKDNRRFLGLRIVHAEDDVVLYDARIFERGRDVSFAELSRFVREGGAWRYEGGRLLARGALDDGFTLADFVAAADAAGA